MGRKPATTAEDRVEYGDIDCSTKLLNFCVLFKREVGFAIVV
jgi:hypothetical protein